LIDDLVVEHERLGLVECGVDLDEDGVTGGVGAGRGRDGDEQGGGGRDREGDAV
jgi:hypothetical protein